ncbi:Uncharacterised protein [Mycobacteroides abscessus]|nr:Uncharacterised protein [Mycobacteroides abscessus]
MVPEDARTDSCQCTLGDHIHTLSDVHRHHAGRCCGDRSLGLHDRGAEVRHGQSTTITQPHTAVRNTALAGLVGGGAALAERFHHGVDGFRPSRLLLLALLALLVSTEARRWLAVSRLVIGVVGQFPENVGALLVGVEDTEVIVYALTPTSWARQERNRFRSRTNGGFQPQHRLVHRDVLGSVGVRKRIDIASSAQTDDLTGQVPAVLAATRPCGHAGDSDDRDLIAQIACNGV